MKLAVIVCQRQGSETCPTFGGCCRKENIVENSTINGGEQKTMPDHQHDPSFIFMTMLF
ncbi:MAG: hypothetical protein ACOC3T_00390 [Bacteroidota bacterium]